jgi:hypothetical protein
VLVTPFPELQQISLGVAKSEVAEVFNLRIRNHLSKFQATREQVLPRNGDVLADRNGTRYPLNARRVLVAAIAVIIGHSESPLLSHAIECPLSNQSVRQ